MDEVLIERVEELIAARQRHVLRVQEIDAIVAGVQDTLRRLPRRTRLDSTAPLVG